MWHKKYVIIGLLVGAVMMAGIVGGVALAQTTGAADSSSTTLMARVAAILGIDQQKVEDAFAKAQQEMQTEAMDSQLKALVEAGTLTQEQADQYKTWWHAMPDVPDGIGLPGIGGAGRSPRHARIRG